MKQLQHGDVTIQEIKSLPKGIVPVSRENGRLILARGEATGHNHSVLEKTATLYQLGSELYMEVSDPVVIVHEEHKPLTVPTGIYKIGQVVERDWQSELVKRVVD